MKSICIKTNDSPLINYLLNEFNYIEIKPVCYTKKKFKNYQNIIVHYLGSDNVNFIYEISCILSCLIIDEYEETILKNLLKKNYFYFSTQEINRIIEIYYNIFSESFNKYFDKKYNILINCFKNYLSNNKSLIFTGFLNFRIKKYISFLEELLDEAVNTYIIEKEYLEFVSLLKLYINSQESKCEHIHLIYINNTSKLLDKHYNKINVSQDIFKTKYLSDISFSSNDYALNSLLTLLPQKIYVHLIDGKPDEFINTLKLIFEKRLLICTDCDICHLYKNNKAIK